MTKVLVVDDDLNMLTLVRAALEKDGHWVDTEADATAVDPARCQIYDLILLDVMMPKEDGFSLCRRIRSQVDCPILFLTAKTEDAALVQGFGLGADDYIKKPFSIAELRARVNAHIRREVRQPTRTISRGGLRFDMQAKLAVSGDHTLSFTKGEYAICEYLALHVGQVFTKEQLYEAVFGFDAKGDSTAIAEHIKNIRAKLKAEDLSPIETVWGVAINGKKKVFYKPFLCTFTICCGNAWLHAGMCLDMVCSHDPVPTHWHYLSKLSRQPTSGADACQSAKNFCFSR